MRLFLKRISFKQFFHDFMIMLIQCQFTLITLIFIVFYDYKTFHLIVIQMELQFPSPQEIYDLTSDQLNKLQQSLRHFIKQNHTTTTTVKQNNKHSQDQLEKYSNLLESIQLQVEERKTLEFFNEIYQLENPYVKKITDFNNQFAKLAAEAIEKQQQTSRVFQKQSSQKSNTKKYSQQQTQHTKNFQKKNQTTKYSSQSQKNTLSENSISQHSPHTHTGNGDNLSQASFNQRLQTDIQNKSVTSMASFNETKKMGIGFQKKNKKKLMQEFMKAALSKAKVSEYVVSKNGILTTLEKSPQKKTMTNLPMSNTGRPVVASNRSIGASTTTSVIANEHKKPSNGSASISKKTNHPKNDKQMIKKKQQAVQKLKSMKNTTKQATKIDRNFVQMVKKQEQKKRKKIQKEEMQKQMPKVQKKIQLIKSIQIQQKIQEEIFSTNQKQERNSSSSHQTKKQPFSHQKPLQNQAYQIKQEINIVSSDTQDDTRKNSAQKKETKNIKAHNDKQKKYSLKAEDVIKQQDMEESLVIKIKEKKFQTQKEQTHQQLQDQSKMTSVSSNNIGKENEKPSLLKISPQDKQKQKLLTDIKKTSQKNLKSNNAQEQVQKFGQITQEVYSANNQAYDFQKEAQQYKKQTPYYGDDDNDSNQSSSEEDLDGNLVEQRPMTKHKMDAQSVSKISAFTKSLKQLQQNVSTTKNNKTKKQKKHTSSKTKLKKQSLIITQSTQQPQQNKKCYNQQYWLHIKQEAELKIQRFKEQKQLIQRQKVREVEQKQLKKQMQIQMAQRQKQKLRLLQKYEEQNALNENKQSSPQNRNSPSLEEDQNDKFIKDKNEQFKRMSKTMTKKATTKKTSTIVKQPKIIYERPQFNYLDVFPTFNHLFNIMYLKPSYQALLDIPVIMRQLAMIFEAHLEHFKQKNSHFKPAIFLPFDHSNNLQLTDARQLLMHAETTYVNLKTLVQRLQVFNANLQGQFQNSDNRYYRVVKTKEEVYDIITTSFLRRKGWKELPHGCNLRASWNLFWSWSKPQVDMNKLLVIQKINHFPFNKNLSRKDLLYKNIQHFRKTHKVPFPFLPLTFNLPKQFTQFSKKFHQQQLLNRNQNYWIMKPIGKSRGRGIKVINSLSDINYVDNIVVQKYINNPMLLEGYKFDMRIYVLVTSFHPLQAFVYKEGFARLSTQKFTLEPNAMKNNFVHLTNFAINRHNHEAVGKFSGGSKISLKSLKDKLTKMGHSWNSVWAQVHEIIIKSLLACSISVPSFPGAFQLFGYDIMIDTQQQCQLIQINSSPSLERSYLIDQIVKQSLIDDIMDIVDPPDFDKQELVNIVNERLTENKKKYSEQEDLIALARVLKYKKIRKLGQVPQKIGLFQMIAPGKMSTDLQKFIKFKSGINNPHNID